MFEHESIYRSAAVMKRIGKLAVTVAGAGALGANLLESCARQGFRRLRVIDRDRVEERNLSTQPYSRRDIGQPKARILSREIFRAVGTEVAYEITELSEANVASLLRGSDVVVDCFDNARSRSTIKNTCLSLGIPCLHVGLNGDYAEIIWNETYRVPEDGGEDVCDYPLARNVVLLAVAAAGEELIRFARGLPPRNWTITLRDLAIRNLMPSVSAGRRG